MIVKENIDTYQNTPLSSKEPFIFKMSENIDSDYITFILGFISSILINDVYSIVSLRVKEDAVNFWFTLLDFVLLTFVTIMLLTFAVGFSKIQKELSPHKTVEARRNYFQEKLAGDLAAKLSKKLLCICIFSPIVLLLNITKFICVNWIL